MNLEEHLDEVAYGEFIHFIEERESIRKKKEAGEPRPWTEDLFLQKYLFTNVWRQDDKTTKALQEKLKPFKGASFDKHPELLPGLFLNIFLLRLINNVEQIRTVPLAEHGNIDKWDVSSLNFSSAFVVLPALKKGTKKIDEIKRLLKEIDDRIHFGMSDPKEIWDLPRIQGLVKYEMMLDYWQFMDLPEEYCNIGGGAEPTLRRLFPTLKPSVEQIQCIVDDINRIANHIHHEKWGPLTMRTIEGMCCEFRKWKNLQENPTARRRYYRP